MISFNATNLAARLIKKHPNFGIIHQIKMFLDFAA